MRNVHGCCQPSEVTFFIHVIQEMCMVIVIVTLAFIYLNRFLINHLPYPHGNKNYVMFVELCEKIIVET